MGGDEDEDEDEDDDEDEDWAVLELCIVLLDEG